MDNIKTLQIIPFTSVVLGVKGQFTFLRGEYFDGESSFPHIIKIKTSTFLRLCRLWLQRKAEYCKSYGHFCGAHGAFYSTDFKRLSKTMTLTVFEDHITDAHKVQAPIFEVISLDETLCDMEHG